MKYLKFLKSNKGSFTIEACYTFLFTLLAIMFTIFIGSVYYQRAYIQSLADRAVKKAALACNNPSSDFVTGEVDISKLEGFSIFDLYSDPFKTGDIEKKGKEYIENNLNRSKNSTVSQLLNTSNSEVNFSVSNYLVFKTISAEIKVKGRLPINFFGLEEDFYITAKSVTSVNNPRSFIDNVDFVKELIDKYKK